MQLIIQLLCKNVVSTFSIINNNNFNCSLFHNLIEILIPDVNMFGMWHGCNIASHKYYTYIINCMTRSSTEIFMLPNNWITNITSLTTYRKATHSTSELDSIMFCCTLLPKTGTPRTNRNLFLSCWWDCLYSCYHWNIWSHQGQLHHRLAPMSSQDFSV